MDILLIIFSLLMLIAMILTPIVLWLRSYRSNRAHEARLSRLRRKLRTGDAQGVIDELIDHKRSSG